MRATKKHKPDKMIWERWVVNFKKEGLDNKRLGKLFRRNFTLDFKIVNDLFNDNDFMMHIKKNRILSKENSFMAFLYKCKTGFYSKVFDC